MNREDIIRTCMVRSASEGLKVIRKLMNIGRNEISRKTGIPEDTLSDIETGRAQLSESCYVALSAFFDNFFSRFNESDRHATIRKNLVKEVLDMDYEDSEIPEWYRINVQKVFENMSFLEKWFASFDDIINQLHTECDKELTDNEIELLVENYNIFIDDSVIRDENFSKFISKFAPFLSSEDRQEKIFIARTSLDQLDNNAASALQYDNILGIFESAGTLKEIFIENPENRFILITNDSDLAKDIMFSQQTKIIRKSPVLVAYLYTSGNIALYDEDFSKTDSLEEPEENTQLEETGNEDVGNYEEGSYEDYENEDGSYHQEG